MFPSFVRQSAATTAASTVTARDDAWIVQCLVGALFLGIVALLSLPAARGVSAWFGAMPLWLLGMPLTAIAAARLLRRTSAASPSATAANHRPRSGAQIAARRRSTTPARSKLPRAA